MVQAGWCGLQRNSNERCYHFLKSRKSGAVHMGEGGDWVQDFCGGGGVEGVHGPVWGGGGIRLCMGKGSTGPCMGGGGAEC